MRSSIASAMQRFRPGIAPTLVVLVLLPLMVGLGFWQLSRGHEKQLLVDRYAERRAAEPVSSAQLNDMADPAFRRVHLRGQLDGEHSVLLDNRMRDGKAGVELLQPFHDQASGLWLLLNRGWLPWPDRRIAPAFTTPEQTLNLDAWVYVAPGETFQLHADPAAAQWPRLLTALHPQALWAELERRGFAFELRAEAGPATYETQWPVVAMGPEKHLGYAVQWFAMALALLGVRPRWDTGSERVSGVEIITTCRADKQYATILTDNMIGAGVHINAIGGDCPGKTELHKDIVARASMFLEYPAQTRIEGEIQKLPQDHAVTELWQVMTGAAQGRRDSAEITLFDSVGFAIEDFSALRYVHGLLAEAPFYQTLDMLADPDDPRDLFGMVARARPEVAA